MEFLGGKGVKEGLIENNLLLAEVASALAGGKGLKKEPGLPEEVVEDRVVPIKARDSLQKVCGIFRELVGRHNSDRSRRRVSQQVPLGVEKTGASGHFQGLLLLSAIKD